MKKIIVLFLFIVVFYGCKKNTQTKDAEDLPKKSDLSIVKKHTSFTELTDFSLKKIETITEYTALNNFITRFKNITPNEALSNALELKNLVTNLKDSLPLETLKNPSFNARINVLENEALRLVDMSHIPSITSKEVNLQVAKILNSFGYTNEKINTLFLKNEIEENLTSIEKVGKIKTPIKETKNTTNTTKENSLQQFKKTIPTKKVEPKRVVHN